MKNYKYWALSFIVAVGFSSCLDENPLYSQNNNIVFASESNAELALLGCYAHMASTSAYGQHFQEIPVSASGFGWSQRNGSDNIVSLISQSSDGLVSTTWNGMYKVISEANAFIENMERSGLSSATKVQLMGEAKFLRALAYYNLVSLFGDIPLKTVASTSEGISIPRSPKEQIFAQIVDDLNAALAIKGKKESTVGRINSDAVKAYLGKVYHKMACLDIDKPENLERAKKMFDEVYNSHVYQLDKNFAGLFGEWVNNSPESIFQINFSVTSSSCFNRASNRFSPTASTTGVNWSTYRATKAAYDLHQGTYPGDPRIAATYLTAHRARKGNNQKEPKLQVGDKLSANDSVYLYPYITYRVVLDSIKMPNGKMKYVYDSISKGGKNVEPRIYVTRLPYDKFENPTNPSLDYLEKLTASSGTSAQEVAKVKALRNVRKYFAESGSQNAWPAHAKMYDQSQQGTASHKNLMVYRYAEMLLLMADTYNELGSTTKAIELAEEVLKRARESQGGENTGEPKAWLDGMSQEKVREKLYFERIFELFGEPSMYDMIRLKGVKFLKEALEYHNHHDITKASDKYYYSSSQRWTDRIYNSGNLDDNFLKMNLLLPIPDSERDANPGITDNNFGY